MRAIIFRHQLFKISEPFIAQQSEALKKFTPIYVGRTRFNNAPQESISLALDDIQKNKKNLNKIWQVLTRDCRDYKKLLEGTAPLLIHAHFGVEGVYALPLAKSMNLPLITTFHGFDATTSNLALVRSGSPSWFNYALLKRKLAQSGDLFLCVSEFIRNKVLAMGFPSEKTHVHYIGIDTDKIQPRLIIKEQPIIVHVARLVKKKGTEYLIRAFAKSEKRIKKAKLIIIGDGPLMASLKILAQDLKISDKVSFLGALQHSEVLEYISSASVLVLPSVTADTGDAEGLGMVLLEASALGVPLIGTNHGGIPEVIKDGKTGYLVPERDIDALAEKIYQIMSDNNQRHLMGKNARL